MCNHRQYLHDQNMDVSISKRRSSASGRPPSLLKKKISNECINPIRIRERESWLYLYSQHNEINLTRQVFHFFLQQTARGCFLMGPLEKFSICSRQQKSLGVLENDHYCTHTLDSTPFLNTVSRIRRSYCSKKNAHS